MVYLRLKDMTMEQLRSLLEGPKIAFYYKSDTNATSEIQLAAVPLNVVKTFSRKIHKVFSKYPGDKSYTITSGAKYAYTMIFNHMLSRCQAGKTSPLSRRHFIDYGNAVNVLNSLEMTYFANDVHRRMKALAAGPLLASVVGEVYHEFDVEEDAWVRAMVVKGVAEAKFSGRLSKTTVHRYYARKVCKASGDDVRGALAGLQAAAKFDNQDTV